MRYHYLRFDIWLCLLLGFLVSLGTGKIAEKLIPEKYEEYKEEHKVETDNIGGIASESIFRAQNIEDLLTHDIFTVESPGIEYKNKGAGFYKGMYLQALTLPSGQLVAARINSESVTNDGESIYSGTSTLPVGKIIKEDLKKEKTFIEQIEYKEPLSRTDFYIDMVGDAEIINKETYIDTPIILIELLTIILTFPIFHLIGSKLGIFPYIFAPKKNQKQEWN